MRLRDIKKGEAIKFRNEVWVVVDRTEVTRGNWATNWQVKLRNLMKGNIIEQRFAPVEDVEQIDLQRQEYEYLYDDGSSYVFMDPSSYEQINVSRDVIEEDNVGPGLLYRKLIEQADLDSDFRRRMQGFRAGSGTFSRWGRRAPPSRGDRPRAGTRSCRALRARALRRARPASMHRPT